MRPTLAATLAMTLALAFVLGIPAAQAVEYGFGSAVGGSDYDFSPLAESQRVALCFLDTNGDGAPSVDEPVFLVTRLASTGVCPATLSTPAILLNRALGRAAGTEANAADAWGSRPVASLTDLHALRYVEDGSDTSKLDAKDTLYLDIRNVARATVDVGDIRLSGNGPGKAGTTVQPGDADLSRPLADIRGSVRQVHGAGMVYKAGSAFYVNADAGAIGGTVDGTCATTACPVTGDLGVESGDVRLNAKAVNPVSDTATILPDRVELVTATVGPGQPFQVTVTAKNTGKAPGAGLVETTLDGVLVDGRGTPTIEPNGVAVLTITLLAPLAPGPHVVKSGTYADFLQVEAAPVPIAMDGTNPSAAAGGLASVEDGRATLKAQGASGVAPLGALGALVAVLLRRRAA